MKIKKPTCFAGHLLIFIIVFCVADIFAQTELFVQPSLAKEKSINNANLEGGLRKRPEFKRGREMLINWKAFEQKKIVLNLFDDTKITADFTEIYKGDTSDYEAKEIWIGEVENKPFSNVRIYKYGKYITGRIYSGGQLFGIDNLDNGMTQVTEFDATKIMSEGDDILFKK